LRRALGFRQGANSHLPGRALALEVQVGFFLHTPLNVFPAFRSPLDGLSVEIGLRCTQFDLEFSDVAMALLARVSILDQAESGRHALVRSRAGRSHAFSGLRILAAALRFGCALPLLLSTGRG